MKNIKTQQLRYFVAVYKIGSITAAARQVNATQSGVSMQIREFEENLGLTLFERVSTGVKPTKAGELIYRRANRILREIDEFENDVKLHKGQPYGSVRAGIMPTFSRSILAPTLIEFAEHYPFVEVKVIEGYSETLTAKVANEELDFAIVPAAPLLVGVRSTHVDTDIEVLAQSNAGGDLPAAHTELATSPPLKLALPGGGNARRPKIDRYLQNVCQSDHTILELDSMMATFDLLAQGNYASIFPGCLCISKLDDPKTKLSPIRNPALTVDYLLIEPSTKATSPIVSAFEEALCDCIKRTCDQGRAAFLDS